MKTKKRVKKIKKVVVNRCYGGFGLSPVAIATAVKRGYSFVTKTSVEEYYGDTDKRIGEEEKKVEGFTVSCFGSVLEKGGFVYTLDKSNEPEFRSDKDLVKLVEELGKKANSRFSELEVVKIPANVKFEIEEYDGSEWVSEVHRTW